MEVAVKVTESGGYLFNMFGAVILIILGIVFIYVSYYYGYQDPIDPNKRTNKITITYFVFGFFIIGSLLLVGSIQRIMLINSDVGYMVNTATGIGGIKNIITGPFRR